jgi:hypothetical protein
VNAQEQSNLANARLAERYRPHLESWRQLKKANPGISIPMFLKTTPAYFTAKPRLIVVGQETHGWFTTCKATHEDLTVKEVMDFYPGDEMTAFRQRSQSPYWRAIRKIAAGIGLDDFCHALMTSNLFPCDSDKGQAPKALLETMRDWRILPQELEILEPELVIFFAGPFYSYNLGCYFGTEVLPPLSPKNRLQAYTPQSGSWKGWVTYHPRSLQLSRASAVLDRLIGVIQGKPLGGQID